jgi:hypothetical protein
MKGVNVEAVLRVEENEEDGRKRKNVSRRREAEDDLGLSMLIDSQNNQYILTKPRDSTMPRSDPHLIKVKPPFFPWGSTPTKPQNLGVEFVWVVGCVLRAVCVCVCV